jgi:16S rRNA (guanine966-N2)-methyltransferase
MKVISGILKGRNIEGYNIDGTRPTMDRVKESLFAMLQNNMTGSVVLDLFSGSGNLGIEALSNGAKMVYFNDSNRKCINVIKENLYHFNIVNNSIVLNYDYKKTLEYLIDIKIKFDIIFLDPPYKDQVNEDIIKIILDNNLLNNKGLIVCEANYIMKYDNDNIKLYKERKFGDKYIFIYQRTK